MMIKSNPYAEGFYLAQGAKRIGEVPGVVPEVLASLATLSFIKPEIGKVKSDKTKGTRCGVPFAVLCFLLHFF